VFENYDNRQKTRAGWYTPVGIVCTVFSLGVTTWRCGMNQHHSSSPDVYSNYSPALRAPDWQRLELPGMSIEAPGFATPTGTYIDGRVEGRLPDDFAVTWAVGSMSDAPLRAKIADAVVENANHTFALNDTKELQVAGEPAYEYVFTPTRGLGVAPVVTLTFVMCGGREVQIVVGGTSVANATTRMLGSFRCKPDQSQDLTRASVVVDAMPGWSRLPDEGLVLVNAQGIRVITADLGDQTGSVADAVSTSFKPTGYRLHEPPTTRGDKVFWTGVLLHDGKTIPSAVFAFRCSDDRVATVVVAAPPGLKVDPGLKLADTGRCLGANEPMPKYPKSE
jgi:hypothetical protein